MELSDLPAYINANLFEELQIKDLAKLCYQSTTKFKLNFKIAFSKTVGKYIHERRMYAAADKLTSGKYKTIRDIGVEVGFASMSQFSCAFKKFYGYQPTAVHIRPVQQVHVPQYEQTLAELSGKIISCPKRLKDDFERHFNIPIDFFTRLKWNA